MDAKTLDVLTQLAMKLNTTAEQLWSVLLHQAPLWALAMLVVMAILVLLTVSWTRVVVWKTSWQPETEGNRFSDQEWDDELAFFAWVSVVIAIAVTLLVVLINLNDVVAALFNPQYWALRHFLK